jgi:hypothetical protein
MGHSADSPVRSSRSTATALLLLLEGLDRRDGMKLARRLVERVIADASQTLPDDEPKARATPDGPKP